MRSLNRYVIPLAAASLVACGSASRASVVASSCDSTGAPAPSAWTAAAVGPATFEVNRGTGGMRSQVRWLVSPDSSAIVVMDDPVSIENEALPNGLLFATERTGRVFRMDSVWSAAPSPDWRRLAIGRAVVLGGGESQSIAPERWEAPAARLRALAGAEPALVADSLRAHAFPVSGMGVVEGAAATLVADVADGAPTTPIELVALGGWRVRWSCDGADIFVGSPPTMVQDDAPSASERRVSSRGGAPTSAPPAGPPQWIAGPTLAIDAPGARAAGASLTVRDRVVEARGGRIVVRPRSGSAGDAVHDVGPGIPLAATRSGHFILAIAPRVNGRPHESPERVVVYRVP